MTGRVIHTGQAIVDLVLSVDQLPIAGGDVFASSHRFTAGGGFNVMAAARREGAEVVYAGGHGTGQFGNIVRAALADGGVTVVNPASLDQDTGFCVAIIDAEAERTFISTVGAEGDLELSHLQAAQVQAADIVYVSGYSLFHPANAAVLTKWLPSLPREATVVVDASPMVAKISDEVLADVMLRADVWTVNEPEARLLAHRFEADPEASAERLSELLSEALDATVLVRVNRDGCWVRVPHAKPELVAAFEMTPVDTNGAGDAHTGVLCAGLVEGRPLREAVLRASAAAAIAVTRHGPATSPTRTEIDALVQGASSAQ